MKAGKRVFIFDILRVWRSDRTLSAHQPYPETAFLALIRQQCRGLVELELGVGDGSDIGIEK